MALISEWEFWQAWHERPNALSSNYSQITTPSNAVASGSNATDISQALKRGRDNVEKKMKIMILLTDGEGNYSDRYTQMAIQYGVKFTQLVWEIVLMRHF